MRACANNVPHTMWKKKFPPFLSEKTFFLKSAISSSKSVFFLFFVQAAVRYANMATTKKQADSVGPCTGKERTTKKTCPRNCT